MTDEAASPLARAQEAGSCEHEWKRGWRLKRDSNTGEIEHIEKIARCAECGEIRSHDQFKPHARWKALL